MTARVLFILKRREDYSQDISYSADGLSTGLLNSATFVSNMLTADNIVSEVVVVVDNNSIDAAVTAFKPTHVIIEALWVVPEKFVILSRLHPTVKWIVRLHSEIPFIAGEGIAMSWILGYLKQPSVDLGINAPRCMGEVQDIMEAAGYSDAEIDSRVHYMPNYYPVPTTIPRPTRYHHKVWVDVGCFGAIRPLKNQLLQAIASLRFANDIGKTLRFHINIGRVEMKGDVILKNLQDLFAGISQEGHELVMHDWVDHATFLQLAKQMDIGIQVAFSETFNIVAADMVTSGVPVVVSKEVPWAAAAIVNPTSSKDIADTMLLVWDNPEGNVSADIHGLSKYVNESEDIWLTFLSQ